MAKNVSVDTKSTQEKEEEEEEEDNWKENEMVFYLREDPNCQVYAKGIWRETLLGEVIGNVDTCFLHILTNQRCDSVRDCFTGWSEPDTKTAENWETLCQHIEELDGLEEIIRTEESFGV